MRIEVLPITKIDIGERQRSEMDPEAFEELKTSIIKHGLLNPPTVAISEGTYSLLTGFRRLSAFKSLGRTEIPVHIVESKGMARRLIELDENLKREELPWQDKVKAVRQLHEECLGENPEWTEDNTAALIGKGRQWTNQLLDVADHMEDQRVASAPTLSRAIPAARRVREIQFARTVDALTGSAPAADVADRPADAPVIHGPVEGIHQGDFLKWAPLYNGPKFNVIHCDFPYGIDHQDSDMGGSAHFQSYADSQDVYFALLDCFIKHIDNFAAANCNLMFWYSMKFHQETEDILSKAFDVVPHPLMWMKSDNKGIVSDLVRRPRHIYETAFLAMRGERALLTNVADAYAAPTQKSKALHVSEKPLPVLRHFFRLFVDEHAEVLDPTCGSGTSLRAAHSMRAKRILGLELNEETAVVARAEFNQAAHLAAVAEKAK